VNNVAFQSYVGWMSQLSPNWAPKMNGMFTEMLNPNALGNRDAGEPAEGEPIVDRRLQPFVRQAVPLLEQQLDVGQKRVGQPALAAGVDAGDDPLKAGQSSAASKRSSHSLFLPRRRTMLSASPSCRKSRRAIAASRRRSSATAAIQCRRSTFLRSLHDRQVSDSMPETALERGDGAA